MLTIRHVANNASRMLTQGYLETGGRWACKYWKAASLALLSGTMLVLAYQISITPPVKQQTLIVDDVRPMTSVAGLESSQQSLPQADTIRVILPSPYGQ